MKLEAPYGNVDLTGQAHIYIEIYISPIDATHAIGEVPPRKLRIRKTGI